MTRRTLDLEGVLDLRAKKAADGNWFPACGGTEQPFTVRGVRLQYCWQPSTGRHAYLNLDTDMIMSDADAQALLP